MSAAANRRCRVVGGTVAIEKSISSAIVWPAKVAPEMSVRPYQDYQLGGASD
jgi:hypothetical protein